MPVRGEGVFAARRQDRDRQDRDRQDRDRARDVVREERATLRLEGLAGGRHGQPRRGKTRPDGPVIGQRQVFSERNRSAADPFFDAAGEQVVDGPVEKDVCVAREGARGRLECRVEEIGHEDEAPIPGGQAGGPRPRPSVALRISLSTLKSGARKKRRIRNRSTCASGKGQVPSSSMGFCVAISERSAASSALP